VNSRAPQCTGTSSAASRKSSCHRNAQSGVPESLVNPRKQSKAKGTIYGAHSDPRRCRPTFQSLDNRSGMDEEQNSHFISARLQHQPRGEGTGLVFSMSVRSVARQATERYLFRKRARVAPTAPSDCPLNAMRFCTIIPNRWSWCLTMKRLVVTISTALLDRENEFEVSASPIPRPQKAFFRLEYAGRRGDFVRITGSPQGNGLEFTESG